VTDFRFARRSSASVQSGTVVGVMLTATLSSLTGSMPSLESIFSATMVKSAGLGGERIPIGFVFAKTQAKSFCAFENSCTFGFSKRGLNCSTRELNSAIICLFIEIT
jgi:hypothetical protein